MCNLHVRLSILASTPFAISFVWYFHTDPKIIKYIFIFILIDILVRTNGREEFIKLELAEYGRNS